MESLAVSCPACCCALPDQLSVGALVASADERNNHEPRKARQAAGPSADRWQGRSRLLTLPSGLHVPACTPGLARGALKTGVGSSPKCSQRGLAVLRGSCAVAGILRVSSVEAVCGS